MPKDKGEAKPVMEERISIKAELLDEVLKDYRGPQDFEVIFQRFKKAVVERALGAELTQHLATTRERKSRSIKPTTETDRAASGS